MFGLDGFCQSPFATPGTTAPWLWAGIQPLQAADWGLVNAGSTGGWDQIIPTQISGWTTVNASSTGGWDQIIPTQISGWTTVNASSTGVWDQITPTQISGWTTVNASSTGGWDQIIPTQIPSWGLINDTQEIFLIANTGEYIITLNGLYLLAQPAWSPVNDSQTSNWVNVSTN